MNRLIPLVSMLALAVTLVACLSPTPPATPDFSLGLAPGSLSLAVGASGQTTLTLTPTNGFNATVDLALEGSIVGTGASKVAGLYTPGTPTSGTVTITVGATVPAGTYPLTVRGTSGSLNHTAPLALTVTSVTPPPPPPPPPPPAGPPQITSLPALSAHGVATTITGTDFGATQGSAAVSFGGVIATRIVSWADTQIKVIVPSDSPVGSAVTVEVVTGGGTDQTTARVIKPVTLTAGLSFSLALKPDGGVVAWGDNSKGQTTVPASAQSDVVSIAGNQNFALALKSNGSVIGWGDNGSGQTTIPVAATSEVMAIAAGDGHSLALKTDGSVIAWGYNYNGQATVPAGAQSGVAAVSAGGGYSLALKSDGSVVAWGNLGGVSLPASVNSGVVAIESGTSHALAIKSDGSVVGWGSNTDGRITIPAGATSGVVAVSAGFNHSLVLKDDGSLLAFGNNGTGQITLPIAAQTGVTAIAAGNGFNLAIKTDGSVVGWGDNVHNQTSVPSGLVAAIP